MAAWVHVQKTPDGKRELVRVRSQKAETGLQVGEQTGLRPH